MIRSGPFYGLNCQRLPNRVQNLSVASVRKPVEGTVNATKEISSAHLSVPVMDSAIKSKLAKEHFLYKDFGQYKLIMVGCLLFCADSILARVVLYYCIICVILDSKMADSKHAFKNKLVLSLDPSIWGKHFEFCLYLVYLMRYKEFLVFSVGHLEIQDGGCHLNIKLVSCDSLTIQMGG